MCRTPKRLKLVDCIEILHKEFSKFNDPRAVSEIELSDFLMASFAVFSLKYPSLLSFDGEYRLSDNTVKKENLKNLFKLKRVPSDTQLRDIIDLIDPFEFRAVFKALFSFFQRNKSLESFEFMRINNRPHYLIAGDGTGYFRSDNINCSSCNTYEETKKIKPKKHGHNVFAASLIHPKRKEVLPFCPEPIVLQDGKDKNDCEQNAFKRFLGDFRKEHPKLDSIFVLDALFANEPPIKLLFEKDCSCIIAVKETNGAVFRQVNEGEESGRTKQYEYTFEIGEKIKKQVIHRYRYCKNIHIKQDPNSIRMNFVEFWEEINWIDKDGHEKIQHRHFAWLTDLDVNKHTVANIAEGGRARWKIENETFNTLKNQGYNLEHNYGHGKNNLSVNFIMMMFIAFMVDQIQLASCHYIKKALNILLGKGKVWKRMAELFTTIIFDRWDDVFKIINKEVQYAPRFSDIFDTC